MAHALRGAGIEIALFERDPEPRSTGYQLNVLANGMYALGQIGLAEGLRASGYGAPLRSAPVVDGPTGRVVRELRVPGVDTEIAPYSFYRGDLHRALLDALQGPPPECGRTVEEVVDEPGNGKVRIRFIDGEVREFDFVVGADGAHSRVRQGLFPDHPGYEARFRALLFAAEVDLDGDTEVERLFAAQLREGEFLQLNGMERTAVVAAAGGPRFGVIVAGRAVEEAGEVSDPEQAKDIARAVVRGFRDPRIHHAIDRASWEEGNPLIWRIGDIEPLPAFHRGRVALTGDAAHAMIPVVGQGANQSFEDAMVLSRELGGSATAGSDPAAEITAALDRYSADRQPHVAQVQAEGRKRAAAMGASSHIGYRLGNLVLRWLPQRVFDRFDNHVLAYAIRDPDCSMETL